MRRLLRALPALVAVLVAPGSASATGVGQRDFIDSSLSIPSSIMTFLGTVFPEHSQIGATFLSQNYDPNLVITEAAKVKVTFVWEGAGYLNSFGYFTYQTDGSSITIVDRQLVFPNASFSDPNKGWGGGQLATGDTGTLRDASGNERVFQPGERIGFFIVSNGWSTTLPWWNPSNPTIPSASPATNLGVSNGVFTTIDSINPEIYYSRADIARHAAMVKVQGVTGFLGGADFLVVGMEDIRRNNGSDNDFNDVMFLVQSTPETAIQTSNVLTVVSDNNDPDGDGVTGLADFFPNDAQRAYVTRTPAVNYDTVTYEDLYPNVGDADFNDAVVQYAYDRVTSANGNLKELVGTYHLIARGAGYDHQFSVVIDNIPVGASGTVSWQHFATDGTETDDAATSIAPLLFTTVGGTTALKLTAFEHTKQALPPLSGGLTNTLSSTPDVPPASVRFRLVFDSAISSTTVAAPPYDPVLEVRRPEGLYDIHLPGKSPLPNRPTGLPTESGASSFLDQNSYPFAMIVPFDWRFPLESVRIDDPNANLCAYGTFSGWRGSQGQSNTDWYKIPNTAAPSRRVTDPLGNAVRNRPWTLLAGG
jgi:LruC domain-containing protein